MISKKRWLTSVVAAAMAMGTLASCGTYSDGTTLSDSSETASTSASETSGESSEAASSGGDSFTFIATQPNTLNMIQSQSNLDNYCFYLTQEMLFRPYDGVYEAEVVDTWEVDETNTVYTYHLKETNWSDGTPITADDFAYYLLAQLDPNMGSANASTLITTYGFVNAEAYYNGECDVSEVGIQALDDYTLQLTLEEPKADFDGTNITVYPLDADFVAEQGEALGGTPENYMCSGPYVLTDWTYGSSLTYEKNDEWLLAGEQFPVQTVTMLEATDANTSVSMFESGEADMILTVDDDYLDILSDYLVYDVSGSVRAVQLNTTGQGDAEKAALLSNLNFRNALSYALNRDAIVQAVSPTDTAINRYLFEPMAGNTPESLFQDDYPVESVPLEGDAEQAKAYLQAALDELGYASADELPELSYLTFENDSYRLMAETLVDQWNQVLGLDNISIELKPIPDAIQSMMSYQYDIYYTSLGVGSTPSTFMNYWITGGSVNDVAANGTNLFSNAEFDQLVDEASTTMDREARMGLYAQAEQILIDEAPLIMISAPGNYAAVADYVDGFVYNALDNAIELNHLTVNK